MTRQSISRLIAIAMVSMLFGYFVQGADHTKLHLIDTDPAAFLAEQRVSAAPRSLLHHSVLLFFLLFFVFSVTSTVTSAIEALLGRLSAPRLTPPPPSDHPQGNV